MSHEIATHPERDSYDLSSCETFAAGGAARPLDHIHRIRESFPDAFQMLGYGLTETNCVGCTNVNEHYLAKPASTGPASLPLVELAILGPDGEALPSGKCGEIAIRSICNFREYWNDPEATARAIRPDGFFLTGDIGYLDEDDYLFVVDRKKSIIVRGGENVSCVEVEQAIYSHPGIAEVSVFGLPDERYGEVPVAVYRPVPAVSLCEDELRAFLKRSLAAFKIPVRLWQEKRALPRLGAEKIDTAALKARYSQDWEGAKSAA
jgi:acyl-CoA synthetase (AMP-forming)/AMP-acid ligase II